MERFKLAQLQQAEPAANIQPESCICQPCRDDVSRIHIPTLSLGGEKQIKPNHNVATQIVVIHLIKLLS